MYIIPEYLAYRYKIYVYNQSCLQGMEVNALEKKLIKGIKITNLNDVVSNEFIVKFQDKGNET